MSGGAYSYNRFNNLDRLVEGAKPDFLDMDKDGNKKESFKKAVKDKEKDCPKCGGDDCGCDDKKKDKKNKMPAFLKKEEVSVTKADVIQKLMDEGFVNNEVSGEVLFNHMSDDWLLSLEASIIEGYGTGAAMIRGGQKKDPKYDPFAHDKKTKTGKFAPDAKKKG